MWYFNLPLREFRYMEGEKDVARMTISGQMFIEESADWDQARTDEVYSEFIAAMREGGIDVEGGKHGT